MKERRKIWLAAAIFAIAEAFAFPGMLFPDCIRVKEVQQGEQCADDRYTWIQGLGRSSHSEEKEQKPEFEWKFWFLQ